MKKNSDATLKEIAAAMSGVEWDAQVSNRIAELLFGAGYEIPEPDPDLLPPAGCPTCASRDLYVSETFIVHHPYDAQRHVADACDIEPEDGEGNYAAKCGQCGLQGTLSDFRMKLLAWDVEEGDDDNDDE